VDSVALLFSQDLKGIVFHAAGENCLNKPLRDVSTMGTARVDTVASKRFPVWTDTAFPAANIPERKNQFAKKKKSKHLSNVSTMETARVATAAFKKFRAWTATASLAVNTVRRMLLLTLRNRQFPKMTILLGVLKMKNAPKDFVADMVVSV
jgi:hypothetical protein